VRHASKREFSEVGMPTGKVKWFKVEQGFGFIQAEDGADVFVHASALPEGTAALKPGQRVEFGIADGKRGPQALSVRILDPRPSVVKGSRKAADALAVQLEDLIVLLDKVASDLKSGRYPADSHASKIATILRATADDLDV
jgi:CspA family cold shock protein